MSSRRNSNGYENGFNGNYGSNSNNNNNNSGGGGGGGGGGGDAGEDRLSTNRKRQSPRTMLNMNQIPKRDVLRIKILSMGDAGTGKSCIIKRYCEERVRGSRTRSEIK